MRNNPQHRCLTNHFQISLFFRKTKNQAGFLMVLSITPSDDNLTIKCLSLTKAVMDIFYPFSHTSGNRRFSNFSFFKPKMNYYLSSKLSVISRTRKISSYSRLAKNNLFYLCSTSEVCTFLMQHTFLACAMIIYTQI